MNFNFPRLFGVSVNLKQEIKFWGPISLIDVLILIVAFMFVIVCNNLFWNCVSPLPHIIFSVDVMALGIYSILRPRTNPGKRNIELFFLTFSPTNRYFQSISVYEYVRMSNIFDTDTGLIHRLPVNKADLRGE